MAFLPSAEQALNQRGNLVSRVAGYACFTFNFESHTCTESDLCLSGRSASLGFYGKHPESGRVGSENTLSIEAL